MSQCPETGQGVRLWSLPAQEARKALCSQVQLNGLIQKMNYSFLTEKTLCHEYSCTAFPAMYLDWLELYYSPWHIIYIALLNVSIASFVVFPQDWSVCWLYVLIYQLFVWNRPSRVIRHNIWNLPYLDREEEHRILKCVPIKHLCSFK